MINGLIARPGRVAGMAQCVVASRVVFEATAVGDHSVTSAICAMRMKERRSSAWALIRLDGTGGCDGVSQPVARARTLSTAPLNLSWSPTVGPFEVYCHIVYDDQPAGSVPAVDAYRAIHNGLVAAKPA